MSRIFSNSQGRALPSPPFPPTRPGTSIRGANAARIAPQSSTIELRRSTKSRRCPSPHSRLTDCILHLWCLSSMLPAALDVVATWGFTFKKIGFVWNKLNPSGVGRHMGNGYYTRDEAEFCLLATKGAPTRLDASVRQTFDAPITEHSEKPDEFRHRIERLTAGPYLELYGRRVTEGWTVWGDQVRWEAPLPRTFAVRSRFGWLINLIDPRGGN